MKLEAKQRLIANEINTSNWLKAKHLVADVQGIINKSRHEANRAGEGQTANRLRLIEEQLGKVFSDLGAMIRER
jgi:hypothetical protein